MCLPGALRSLYIIVTGADPASRNKDLDGRKQQSCGREDSVKKLVCKKKRMGDLNEICS